MCESMEPASSEGRKRTQDPHVEYTISDDGKKTFHLTDTFFEGRRIQQQQWREEERKRLEDPDPSDSGNYLSLPGVTRLYDEELERYMCRQDTALVMFYGQPDEKLTQAKKSLIEAAARNHDKFNHPYGAVDCEKYGKLCQQHGAHNLPQFNLYVGGKIVGRYDYDLGSEEMIRLVDRPPVPASKRQRFYKAMCSCVAGAEED